MAINWKNVGEAADVWTPMSQYRVKEQAARKAAAAKTAQDVWNAQVGVLDTVFKENAAQYAALNKGVAEGTFDLSDPTMLDAYTDAFNMSIQSQRDLIEHSGMKVTQPVVRDLTTFFSGVMDNWIAKNPKGDFDVMKWGKKDGLWGDVIKRLDPSINREDAHRVWESLWNERAGKRKGLVSSGEGLIKQATLAGATAETLGVIPDLIGEVGEKAMEGLSHAWTGEADYTPFGQGGSGTRDALRNLFGVESTAQNRARINAEVLAELRGGESKPIITPTDKSVAMGPFAGLDNGLISGFMARGEDPVAAEVTEIGEDVDELKEAEQRAQEREVEKGQKIRNITQEAATFLANYLQMLLDHGEDEAKSMMSRDFANLSSSAKKDVANYLMSQ
jgi:hypothetical protein